MPCQKDPAGSARFGAAVQSNESLTSLHFARQAAKVQDSMAHRDNIENNDTTILNVEAVQIVVDGYLDSLTLVLWSCGGEGTPFLVRLVQSQDLAWDHPVSLETETAKYRRPAFMLLLLNPK